MAQKKPQNQRDPKDRVPGDFSLFRGRSDYAAMVNKRLPRRYNSKKKSEKNIYFQ